MLKVSQRPTTALELVPIIERRPGKRRSRWGQNWHFTRFISYRLGGYYILMCLVSYNKLPYFWSVLGQIHVLVVFTNKNHTFWVSCSKFCHNWYPKDIWKGGGTAARSMELSNSAKDPKWDSLIKIQGLRLSSILFPRLLQTWTIKRWVFFFTNTFYINVNSCISSNNVFSTVILNIQLIIC